jgi:hypothetical protein
VLDYAAILKLKFIFVTNETSQPMLKTKKGKTFVFAVQLKQKNNLTNF